MGRAIPKEVRDSLRSVDLFSACTKSELRAIAGLGTPLSMSDGAILTQQGAIGREFFLLVEGHARCFVDGDQVKTFGPGDFFGEMSLIDREPRSATVIAEGGAELVVFNPAEFHHLLKFFPSIAQKVRTAMDLRRQATPPMQTDQVTSWTEPVTSRAERDATDLVWSQSRGWPLRLPKEHADPLIVGSRNEVQR
jgi:CRP/FNR family transcriptional regulator, cyclic AMP receptor protein